MMWEKDHLFMIQCCLGNKKCIVQGEQIHLSPSCSIYLYQILSAILQTICKTRRANLAPSLRFASETYNFYSFSFSLGTVWNSKAFLTTGTKWTDYWWVAQYWCHGVHLCEQRLLHGLFGESSLNISSRNWLTFRLTGFSRHTNREIWVLFGCSGFFWWRWDRGAGRLWVWHGACSQAKESWWQAVQVFLWVLTQLTK